MSFPEDETMTEIKSTGRSHWARWVKDLVLSLRQRGFDPQPGTLGKDLALSQYGMRGSFSLDSVPGPRTSICHKCAISVSLL